MEDLCPSLCGERDVCQCEVGLGDERSIVGYEEFPALEEPEEPHTAGCPEEHIVVAWGALCQGPFDGLHDGPCNWEPDPPHLACLAADTLDALKEGVHVRGVESDCSGRGVQPQPGVTQGCQV